MSRKQAARSERARDARTRRRHRWILVRGCGTANAIGNIADWRNYIEPVTRIPRSLRRLFGFRVAP